MFLIINDNTHEDFNCGFVCLVITASIFYFVLSHSAMLEQCKSPALRSHYDTRLGKEVLHRYYSKIFKRITNAWRSPGFNTTSGPSIKDLFLNCQLGGNEKLGLILFLSWTCTYFSANKNHNSQEGAKHIDETLLVYGGCGDSNPASHNFNTEIVRKRYLNQKSYEYT